MSPCFNVQKALYFFSYCLCCIRWPWSARHHRISQNTTAFHKTLQHFRKRYSISEKAAAFHKTLHCCDWLFLLPVKKWRFVIGQHPTAQHVPTHQPLAVSTHSELTAPHICSETGQKYKPQTVYVMVNTVTALQYLCLYDVVVSVDGAATG